MTTMRPKDDNVFDDNKKEEDKETPGGLSVVEVQAMLDSQAATFQAQLDKSQAEITRLSQPSDKPVPKDTADEFIDKFSNDPRAAIEEITQQAADQARAEILPILRQTNNTTNTQLLDSERRAVDAEYGAGAWDTHIAPTITARMDKIREGDNALSLSDPTSVRNEVLGVLGLKRNELSDLKSANIAKAGEDKDAATADLMKSFRMTGLTGGTKAPIKEADAPHDEAELEFIASKKIAGQTVDIKKLRATIARGTTSYSAWQEAQPKPKTGEEGTV